MDISLLGWGTMSPYRIGMGRSCTYKADMVPPLNRPVFWDGASAVDTNLGLTGLHKVIPCPVKMK